MLEGHVAGVREGKGNGLRWLCAMSKSYFLFNGGIVTRMQTIAQRGEADKKWEDVVFHEIMIKFGAEK